jgi:hypothetical protein
MLVKPKGLYIFLKVFIVCKGGVVDSFASYNRCRLRGCLHLCSKTDYRDMFKQGLTNVWIARFNLYLDKQYYFIEYSVSCHPYTEMQKYDILDSN